MAEYNKIQGELYFYDYITLITRDVSGNLTFTDNIAGTKTLTELAAGGALSNDITSGVGWDASTNVPTIFSGIGNTGDFAVVGVAGTTTVDGINVWAVGDYIWFDGDNFVWRKIISSASAYVLPVADIGILGGILDGTDLSIDASGNVSVVNDSHTHNTQYLGLTGGTGTGVYTLATVYAGTGQITSSAAVLQVNGFQRTGNVLIHEGGSIPTSAFGTLGNVSGDLVWDSNIIWHAGDMGSGSGLDADTVDGQHASAFLGVSAKAADSDKLDGIDSVYYRGLNYYPYSGGIDPNDATYPYILSNKANTPNSSYYWHIRTQFYSGISATANRVQIAIQYNSGHRAYVRSCYSNVWSAWTRLDNDDSTLVKTNTTQTISGSKTFTNAIYLENSSQYIREGVANTVRLGSTQGYVDIGSLNTSWCHYNTNRAAHYFYESLTAPDFKLSSDIYFKKNIRKYENGLSKVLALQPVLFEWDETKPREGKARSGEDLGMIAQWTEKVEPLLVDKEGDGFKSLKYNKITVINTAAIQELYQENLNLRTRITELEDKFRNLETLLINHGIK